MAHEVREITQAFARTANFPDVLGAIDGTHIPITAPKEHAAKYINRKGFHSILLQAVCNPNLEFIDCFTRGPGCMHDSRMLRKSPLMQKILQNPNDVFYGKSHLLGDAAYPLSSWMIVPFRDNGHLTLSQISFNKAHSSTRSTIERAFGLLKGRFRRLKLLDMKKTELIPAVILSCCILHNICLKNEDNIQSILEDNVNCDDCDSIDEPIYYNNELDFSGETKRNNIINTYFLN